MLLFLTFYSFLTLHVEILNGTYKGQKLIKLVNKNTTANTSAMIAIVPEIS